MNIEEMIKDNIKSDEEYPFPYEDMPKEDFTCYTCEEKEYCKYAFDAYNTDGDCLAYK